MDKKVEHVDSVDLPFYSYSLFLTSLTGQRFYINRLYESASWIADVINTDFACVVDRYHRERHETLHAFDLGTPMNDDQP